MGMAYLCNVRGGESFERLAGNCLGIWLPAAGGWKIGLTYQ